jgi:hypothetical protein
MKRRNFTLDNKPTKKLECNCKQKLEKKIRGTAFNDNFLITTRFDTIMMLKLLEKQCEEQKYYTPFEDTNYDMSYLYNICIIGMEVYTIKEMYEMISIVEEHSKHQTEIVA